MKKGKNYIIFSIIISIFAVIFSIILNNAEAGSLQIMPSSGELVKGCSYPFEISMDTTTDSSFAVDSKLFLSGLIFDSLVSSDMDHSNFLTGIAIHPLQLGKEYFYLNTYQDPNNNISGSNINLGSFYFIVTTGVQTTGSIEFYYIGPGINSDDSNITKGLNSSFGTKYTQYQDILTSVTGGYYTFVDNGHCWPISTMISGYYYQTTYQDSGFSITDYLSNIKAGYDFDYPNLYPGDTLYNSRVYNTGRTIRTNTAVVLTITGDLGFIIDESSIAGLPITILDNSIHSISKTLIITGNINNIPLTRSTSGNIYDQFVYTNGGLTDTGIFLIDVFWIDDSLPELTGLIEYYTGSFAFVTLSGYTSGVNWSTIDDEFKILNFSGIFSAPTNYLTSSNNKFSLQHKLDFSSVWSGYIIYIDRAGNTGEFFLDLLAFNKYIVKAHPQGRLVTTHTPSPNLATIGEVSVYDETYLLIATGTVITNNYGIGFLSLMEPLSGHYFVTFNGLAHLQSVISGTIIINETNRFIDFTNGDLTRLSGPIKDDILIFQTQYLNISPNNFSDLRFDELFYGYSVRDGLRFKTSSGVKINNGVQRDNIILNTTQAGEIDFIANVKDDSIVGFNLNPTLEVYSGTENITNSGYLQITTGTKITSVEIAGELIKDTTINAVDASVIIDYILTNGATNSNSEFGYIAEDLNANGQVDTADITIWGYNLMRWGTSFP